MKSKKGESRNRSLPALPLRDPASRLYFYALAAAALVSAWWAYSPALNGPFLFDDTTLPFAWPNVELPPLSWWVAGARPVVKSTYWLNTLLSGRDPFPYHVLNLVFHLISSGLVFLIIRRLLGWAHVPESRRALAAGFATALFLLHPAQTEAVAYITGRYEVVSVMFAFAAFTVFLYRPASSVSWPTVCAVLALFGLALLSKEHSIVLPALLLLTDYWWNPGFSFQGIRENWRLYAPVALGAVAGVVFFLPLILHSTSAGFGLKDLRWYEYLFTQFRAIFVYLGMFLLPVHLNADWDFPLSRTILDRGAFIGLSVLLLMVVMAWRNRRRYPLATYGFFMFLVLMAPTSSILPIRDPVAERRIYFSMIGLLLVVSELLVRVNLERKVLAWSCAAIALTASIGTHARAALWSDPVRLWEDTAAKSPGKSRVHQQLAEAYYNAERYDLAVAEYEKAKRVETPDYNMLMNWGLAYHRLYRFDDALSKFREAAALESTAHVYSQIGMIYVQIRRRAEALDALATAQRLDPNWAPTYNYRAKLYFQENDLPDAVAEYRHALALDYHLTDAADELKRAEAQLAALRR